MVRRFLSQQSTSIASAAALVSVLSLGSRVLGLLRDRLLAGTFGAGDALDAYYAAFRIPDFVFSLIVLGAISAGFIPVFVKLKEEDGWRFANTVLSWLGATLAISAALFMVFASRLVPLITPGFQGEKLRLAIELSRIMACSPVLLGLSNIFGAILQSRRRFFVYALSPALYNLGIIVGIVALVPLFGIHGLAWGVVLGAVLHMGVQAIATMQLGFRFEARFASSADVRRLIGLSISRVGGILLSQLDLFVATIVATTLASGSLAIFQLANNIQVLPIGLIGLPLALAAFPALSDAGSRDPERFRRELGSTTLLILFFILPLTVLMLLLRAQIVRIVLGGDAFDWRATTLTFRTLQWFALSLFAQSLIPLFARALYALEESFLPLISGLCAIVVSVLGYVLLAPRLGVEGLAFAASAGFLVQCAVLYVSLQRRINAFEDGALLRSLGRFLFASAGMAGWVQLAKAPASYFLGTKTFLGVAAQGAVAGLAGIVVYLVLCWLLRAPELWVVTAGLRRRLVRQAPVPQESVEALERP